jgi:hypothetical protein
MCTSTTVPYSHPMLERVHTRPLVITLVILLAGVVLNLVLNATPALPVGLLLAAAAVIVLVLLVKRRRE